MWIIITVSSTLPAFTIAVSRLSWARAVGGAHPAVPPSSFCPHFGHFFLVAVSGYSGGLLYNSGTRDVYSFQSTWTTAGRLSLNSGTSNGLFGPHYFPSFRYSLFSASVPSGVHPHSSPIGAPPSKIFRIPLQLLVPIHPGYGVRSRPFGAH